MLGSPELGLSKCQIEDSITVLNFSGEAGGISCSFDSKVFDANFVTTGRSNGRQKERLRVPVTTG